jgi:hypothetical protein
METKTNKQKNTDAKVIVPLGRIEIMSIDYSKYAGKKAKIGSVETFNGAFGYYMKITTTTIDVIEGVKGKTDDKEIKASRIFSLFTDKNGAVGWGDKGKLVDYMAYKNVKHPDELLGREVTLQMDIKENGKSFLSFI